MKFDFNKLKTDENYKNNYLNNKKIAYEKNMLKIIKRIIEDKYRDEFEERCLKKNKINMNGLQEILKMLIKDN